MHHPKVDLADWWGWNVELKALASSAGLSLQGHHGISQAAQQNASTWCHVLAAALSKRQQPPADWSRRLLHVLGQMGLDLSCTWPCTCAGSSVTLLLMLPAEEQGADLQFLRERGVQAWRRVPLPARDAHLWATGKAEHQGQVTGTARPALGMVSLLACLPPAMPCWTAQRACNNAPRLQCYSNTAITLSFLRAGPSWAAARTPVRQRNHLCLQVLRCERPSG